MIFKRTWRGGSLLLAVAYLLALAGCSSRSAQYNDSVEGTVKLDDQPLGGAIIRFIPEGDDAFGAVASQAVSDDNGHFKLVCENQKPGAAIGKHRIIVTRGRAADPRHRGEREQPAISRDVRQVPATYAHGQKSPLETVVTADKHAGYDLLLKSNVE